MFSLREIEYGHSRGLESEIITTEQAIVYSRSHQCRPKPAIPAAMESPRAS